MFGTSDIAHICVVVLLGQAVTDPSVQGSYSIELHSSPPASADYVFTIRPPGRGRESTFTMPSSGIRAIDSVESSVSNIGIIKARVSPSVVRLEIVDLATATSLLGRDCASVQELAQGHLVVCRPLEAANGTQAIAFDLRTRRLERLFASEDGFVTALASGTYKSRLETLAIYPRAAELQTSAKVREAIAASLRSEVEMDAVKAASEGAPAGLRRGSLQRDYLGALVTVAGQFHDPALLSTLLRADVRSAVGALRSYGIQVVEPASNVLGLPRPAGYSKYYRIGLLELISAFTSRVPLTDSQIAHIVSAVKNVLARPESVEEAVIALDVLSDVEPDTAESLAQRIKDDSSYGSRLGIRADTSPLVRAAERVLSRHVILK